MYHSRVAVAQTPCAFITCLNREADARKKLVTIPPPIRMIEHPPNSTTTTLFSIIIAVYNDWAPLDHTLRSLAEQKNGTRFEVIIADDGSSEAAPESIRRWGESYPLTILRHCHAGISTARNRGVHASEGKVLVFVDADCRLATNCLAVLAQQLPISRNTIIFSSTWWEIVWGRSAKPRNCGSLCSKNICWSRTAAFDT